MGVSVYQKCETWWCPFANHVLGYLAEFTLVQDWCAPADYYRTWWNFDRFYRNNLFLTNVNNENEDFKNPLFKERLTAVKNFGLFLWMQDETVAPKESEWFGFWDDRRDIRLMKGQQGYLEDWIGLRTLYESGRMFFYAGPGGHMHLTQPMVRDMLAPLLLNATPLPSEY